MKLWSGFNSSERLLRLFFLGGFLLFHEKYTAQVILNSFPEFHEQILRRYGDILSEEEEEEERKTKSGDIPNIDDNFSRSLGS